MSVTPVGSVVFCLGRDAPRQFRKVIVTGEGRRATQCTARLPVFIRSQITASINVFVKQRIGFWISRKGISDNRKKIPLPAGDVPARHEPARAGLALDKARRWPYPSRAFTGSIGHDIIA